MGIMSVVSVGLLGTVLVLRAWNAAEELASGLAQATARQVASEFSNFLENEWDKVATAAVAMGQYEKIPVEGRRPFLDGLVLALLEENDAAIHVWSIWLPDVLEGDDSARAGLGLPGTNEEGRFIPGYVLKRTDELVRYLAEDYENEDYFRLPMQGRQIITNPYDRVLAGELRYPSTIAAPIRNSAGDVVGVLGVDMGLHLTLQPIGQDFRCAFSGTLALAMSANATVVSHADADNLGLSLAQAEGELLGEHLIPFDKAVREGREYGFDVAMRGGHYHVLTVPVRISDFPDQWAFAIAIPMDEVHAGTYAMIKFAAIIGALTIVLAILVAFFISRSIARPIVNMSHVLNDIASGDGDLTVALPETGSGETAAAARFFNMTIAKIRELVLSIKNQAEALTKIGDDLAVNMTDTASAMNQISSNIQSIKGRIIGQSASVTQTNATMEQVTANIDKLSGHVDRQSAAVSSASSSIEEMLANIQTVTATLARNAADVQDLKESSETGRSGLQEVAADILEIARESEGLLEINTVMENIASQTNLLSMNAAIEAAHAGDAGKGFAVVADEIRKLAESSGDQSKTIGLVLKKIKGSIDRITGSTEKVLKRFESIDRGIRTVAEQSESMSAAMDEQSQGSRQVLDASVQVSEITGEVRHGSREMLEGSRGVIEESHRLAGVTREITDSMNEMAIGATRVNGAVNSVNELSGRNRENISALVAAVSRFKV